MFSGFPISSFFLIIVLSLEIMNKQDDSVKNKTTQNKLKRQWMVLPDYYQQIQNCRTVNSINKEYSFKREGSSFFNHFLQTLQ